MLALLPLLGVWVLAIISPGPDFVVTVQYASARSRRHGVAVGLGVSCAILVWAVGSLLGLAVLFARVSWLYDVVRLAGAAYLLYLGVRTLWSTRGAAPAADPGPARAGGRPGGLVRAWRVGFLTNIGNPKAAVFFGSLFSALLPVDAGVGLRAAAVALMVAVAVVWFTVVATVFGLDPVARAYARTRRWIDRVMGAVLVALAGRLAFER
ncbi:Threonine/homoserine/homoserine lactone efflux protein [Micromonospora pattaloongensis]|uniref:Threonine/homoserine/homoserine lactone efflux protein n=1 Tax=Micromonospora pattaloongensis TaxID=405436 RepID=A0A1H3MZ78_9ACTN|nr:LysE family transporter [Micromonospora pattaloongensis]SDY81838.1 Threonine/homoserine/homoserine lactone efflux protein [Micromonospora pattaloongensis]